jgi:hypothetical protein
MELIILKVTCFLLLQHKLTYSVVCSSCSAGQEVL